MPKTVNYLAFIVRPEKLMDGFETRKQYLPIFHGSLAEPIKRPDSPPAAPSDLDCSFDVEEAANKVKGDIEIIKSQINKLYLLAREYGYVNITDRDWFEVCLEMAIDFVPGFQLEAKSKRGRPRRHQSQDIELAGHIEAKQASHKTVAASCRNLTKKGQPYEGRNASTLETRYYNFKRRGLNINTLRALRPNSTNNES